MRSPYARPRLEALEDRCVPASLSIAVTYGDENWVTVSGWLTDPPEGEGVASQPTMILDALEDSTTTNDYGYYSVTGRASYLGEIYAEIPLATENVESARVQTQNEAPVLTSFTATELAGNNWLFSGTVTDDSVGGIEVLLEGLQSLNWIEVPVQEDGTFSKTVQLNGTSTDNGTAQATVMDWWGQEDTATFEVYQSGT